MISRDGIVFYRSFYDAIKDLPPEEFKKCACALLEYGLNGTEPSGIGIEKTVFVMAKPQIDKNNQRYENGKNGGKKTKPKPNNNQTVTKSEPNNNKTETKPEPKEKEKVKEKEKDKVKVKDLPPKPPAQDKQKPEKVPFAEFVAMTNDEYASLVGKFGESDTKRLIEILDNYKGSTGKTYKSDYRAILSWVTDRLNKEREQHPAAFGDGLNHDELERIARNRVTGG